MHKRLRIACFAAAATSVALVGFSFGSHAAAQNSRTLLAQRGGYGGGGYGRGMNGGGFKRKGGFHKKGGFQRGGMAAGRMGGGRMGGGRMGGGAPGAAAEHSVAYNCHRICSGYLARTRCDGSRRSPRYPIHHGVDIHIRQGTPLLAIASGEVVSSARGASIGGINVVIHHPPGTVRRHQHVFAVYKHLRSRSPLRRGTHVRRGQRVGTSGKSGTTGGYFGANGFSHLHFETYVSSSAHWPGGKLTNPVSILRGHGWPIACR